MTIATTATRIKSVPHPEAKRLGAPAGGDLDFDRYEGKCDLHRTCCLMQFVAGSSPWSSCPAPSCSRRAQGQGLSLDPAPDGVDPCFVEVNHGRHASPTNHSHQQDKDGIKRSGRGEQDHPEEMGVVGSECDDIVSRVKTKTTSGPAIKSQGESKGKVRRMTIMGAWAWSSNAYTLDLYLNLCCGLLHTGGRAAHGATRTPKGGTSPAPP